VAPFGYAQPIHLLSYPGFFCHIHSLSFARKIDEPRMSNYFTRRQFMTATLATGAASAAAAIPISPADSILLVHHVFFWLKDPSNKQHHQLLKEGLRSLNAIPQIKQLLIGGPASTEKRDVVDNSYHVSELMYFHSLADQAAYQDHPVHKAFVASCSHLWEKVVVYDMLVEQ
jgi:Stress responsive A/B Barrel Domain